MPTISRNKEKNGIEIAFTEKPDDLVIVYLKSQGFRWSPFGKVWYKKYNATLWDEIHSYFDQKPESDNFIKEHIIVGTVPKYGKDKVRPSSFITESTGFDEIIAKLKEKHGKNIGDISAQFDLGRKIEKEHTNDPTEEIRITYDHLWEDPEYYTKAKPKDWAEKEINKEQDNEDITISIEKPKSIEEARKLYNLATEQWHKKRVIDDFVYMYAGDANKHNRQMLLQKLTGAMKKPPISKSGIGVIKTALENWIEKENKISEGRKSLIESVPNNETSSNNKNDANGVKVGTIRPEFMSGSPDYPLIKGKEIQISMPNGEKHDAVFAIVDLDKVVASHNEENFHSEALYPKNAQGNNINDRNYKDDPSAQKAVMDYARELEPERLVTTSRTPSGTPIITVDGFVVSGNNRTMSLKLAAKQYKDNYREYVDYLIDEIEAFGFKPFTVSSFEVMGTVKGYTFRFIGGEKESVTFSRPMLARIDYDFKEYTTQELAKYNKDTKKAERPVDKAIKLSNILRENSRCEEIIADITGQFDTFSEFYGDLNAPKKLAKTLIDCDLLTLQELPAYFSEKTFTETGKEFVENLLASLILDRDALLASEQPGTKVLREKIVTSLPILMKNANLKEGSLKNHINDAVIFQQKMKASGSSFVDFIRQHDMFGEKYDRKTVYVNRLLNEGKFIFKDAIEKYNQSVIQNEGESLFGDKPTVDEIFDRFIVGNINLTEQRVIEASDMVEKPEKLLTQPQKDIIRPEFDKMKEFIEETDAEIIKDIWSEFRDFKSMNSDVLEGGSDRTQFELYVGRNYPKWKDKARDIWEKMTISQGSVVDNEKVLDGSEIPEFEMYPPEIIEQANDNIKKLTESIPEEFKSNIDDYYKTIEIKPFNFSGAKVFVYDDRKSKYPTSSNTKQKHIFINLDHLADTLNALLYKEPNIYVKAYYAFLHELSHMDDTEAIIMPEQGWEKYYNSPQEIRAREAADVWIKSITKWDLTDKKETMENKKNPYIAFFGGKKYELYANSLYEAKTLAIKHFAPSKSKEYLVSVHLAEEEITPESDHYKGITMNEFIILDLTKSLIPAARRQYMRKYDIMEVDYQKYRDGLISKGLLLSNGGINDAGKKLVNEIRMDAGVGVYTALYNDHNDRYSTVHDKLWGGEMQKSATKDINYEITKAKEMGANDFKKGRARKVTNNPALDSMVKGFEREDAHKIYEAYYNGWDEENLKKKASGIPSIIEKQAFTEAMDKLRHFLPEYQKDAMKDIFRGEEYEFIINKAKEIAERVESMPETYGTEGVQTPEKIVYLHYFNSSSDWYIIEKDKGDEEDVIQGEQIQAYGYTILNGDDINAEWGYISLAELFNMRVNPLYRVEMDLYWNPKPFKEIIEKKETVAEDKITEVDREIFGYSFEFEPANEEGKILMDTLSGFGINTELLDYPNGINLEYKNNKYELLDNSGEFKIYEIGATEMDVIDFKDDNRELKTIFKLAKEVEDFIIETQVSPTKEEISVSISESLNLSDYDNGYELNKAIEKLLDKKWDDKEENWTTEEKEFIKNYSGYGGLDKYIEKSGEKLDKKVLFEFFTPDKVIEKMYGLAFKYGYDNGPICEPSCGVGAFFDRRFIGNTVIKHGYEINKYSAKICKLLYPEVIINDGKETMNFEQLFIQNNYTVRNKVTAKYKLVIGNPPYGAVGGVYMGMGEKTYTHASNYIEYFILRGLDLLLKDGLLVYIIGTAIGVPFLDQGSSKIKEMITERGKLLDAYRLPSGIFERTDVTSDIVVFRKR